MMANTELKKIPVSQYARDKGVSTQAVHKRIKKGTLAGGKGNDGRVYVHVDDSYEQEGLAEQPQQKHTLEPGPQPGPQPTEADESGLMKELRRQIEQQRDDILKRDDEIRRLNEHRIQGAQELGTLRNENKHLVWEIKQLQGPGRGYRPFDGTDPVNEDANKSKLSRGRDVHDVEYTEVVNNGRDDGDVEVGESRGAEPKVAQKKTPQNEEKRERRKKKEKEKINNEGGVIHLDIYDAQPVSSQKWWKIWSRWAA